VAFEGWFDLARVLIHPLVTTSQAMSFQADPLKEWERNSPLRHVSLWLALVMVFLRISEFQQLQTFVLHLNLRALYVCGVPAILGTLLCGGVQRAMRGKPTFFWTAFAFWMFASVPKSTWPGGSLGFSLSNLRTNLPMAFAVGGLVIGWREFQLVMRCFAWGAFGTLFWRAFLQMILSRDEFWSLGILRIQMTSRAFCSWYFHLYIGLCSALGSGLSNSSL